MRITRKQTYSALAGIGILLGSAGLAGAATASPAKDPGAQQPAAVTTEHNGVEGSEAPGGSEHDEQPYKSSITVADLTESTTEADEQAALAALATVSSDEAAAAALKAHPGSATDVQLENEDGNVVYSVIVETSQGTVDVKVDAGNATVLAADGDDGDGEIRDGADNEKDDAREAPGTEVADD